MCVCVFQVYAEISPEAVVAALSLLSLFLSHYFESTSTSTSNTNTTSTSTVVGGKECLLFVKKVGVIGLLSLISLPQVNKATTQHNTIIYTIT